MIKLAFVIFRECLEISLLLGVIMAATRPVKNSAILIILGTIIGFTASGILAFFVRTVIVSMGGIADEIFDASVILITSILISFTAVWLQGYTKTIKSNLEAISEQIQEGTLNQFILVSVVAFSVLREGAEIILMVYSISSANPIPIDQTIVALFSGMLSGILSGYLLYRGMLKVAGKYIFKVSTIILIFIAAGLAAQGAGLLSSIGVIEIFSNELWNTSDFVDDNSLVGKILNVLIGYDSRPRAIQMIFYLSTILLTMLMMKVRNSSYFRKRK